MVTYTGKVVSQKSPKTAVVLVESFRVHPKYHKRIVRTKRYLVHDEVGVREGDVVRFVETRPISKLKRWKIIEVLSSST